MNAAINRAVPVVIDGEEFEMLLTTKAAADIDRELGGFDEIAAVVDGEDRTASVAMASKLIALLCNAGTERYNYRHRDGKNGMLDAPRRMIDAEEIGIVTTPGEMEELLHSAVEAVKRGRTTYIESEKNPGDEKN